MHLGAQAGVRYSIDNPRAYVQSNLVGHVNMLELARHRGISHFVYASSSSVYGNTGKTPFSVEDRVDHPVSLYAATKKADELMSETYAHLYRVPMTGLRFFTVYGPWGRPDMALWKFTGCDPARQTHRCVQPRRYAARFHVYRRHQSQACIAVLDQPPADDGPAEGRRQHIARTRSTTSATTSPNRLGRMIDVIEAACGKPAVRNMLPMQPGDVYETYADISAISNAVGYAPTTPIDVGIPRFRRLVSRLYLQR